MSTLLVKNIHTLITMDDERREIRHGALLVRDNIIERVGTTEELTTTTDEVLDLEDKHLVLPGLINTHHHFFQNLTRVTPAGQNGDLFQWLTAHYGLWSNLTGSGMYYSSQLAAAELILSGCTTASDHHYLFPNDCTLDEQIRGVGEVGLRFHASRGSMSVGESNGGLPPDFLVEKEADILEDSQRLIEQYHNPERYSMLRIVLAPCSPFSVSQDLMKESAAMARSYPGVRLHTHLAETTGDVEYSLSKFNLIPGDYAESVGWLGDDVWHAHCVKLSDRSIDKFGQTGTGVAHCPCSNMRLASGIAPIRKMLDKNVPVGLGVDGAASNDATNLLHEARQAFLLARVRDESASVMTARDALEIATRGGAKVLGRDDVGYLASGMAADFVAVNLDKPGFVGTQSDPVAALIYCQTDYVDYSFIDGKKVVDRGNLTTIEFGSLIDRANKAALELAK